MSRKINQLSNLQVKAVKQKGLYADGGGLYLQVATSGSKSWIFRFKRDGRARDMGLGSLRDVTLAEARKSAAEARRQRQAAIDPIEARDAQAAQERLAKARSKTFSQAASEYIEAHEPGWRNSKHRAQWKSTLLTYVFPAIGDLPVAEIGTQDVLNVLKPLWIGDMRSPPRPETASRLRGRIEAIIDAARADDDSQRANPARWKGHLQHKLPKRSKVQAVRHHPALPYRDLPAFIVKLRARQGITPRALEFVILTAARTGEALGARWDEMDLKHRLWTVPAARMKSGREHRVPLSPQAVTILRSLVALRLNDFVFPGSKCGKPLSDMALLMLLRDLHAGVTTHGFRSTFKDWCAEQTNTPNFVSEAALAHVIADKVEGAYRRGELMEKRRKLMEEWADYCDHHKRMFGKVNATALQELAQ